MSHQQTMSALKRANSIRLAQAQLRREVFTGEATIAEALIDARVCANTTVVDLLTWQRRWGLTRARRAVFRAAIAEGKRVVTLTERQRGCLVEVVAGGAETLTPVGP